MSYLTINNLNDTKLTLKLSSETISKVLHIVNSINDASDYKSKIDKLTPDGQSILEYKGMTGTQTRHFYNNICSLPETRYLEIGTWNGSSSISSMYNNKVKGVFIDNWCLFGGNSNIFSNAIQKYMSKDSSYTLLESDCWKVDTETIGKFNVYLYDGEHYEEDHFKALSYYIENMDDEFIYLCDDWNWPEVRDGTFNAIKELDLKVIFRHEIFMSPGDLKGMPNHEGKKKWWNGIGIFLLHKKNA